MNEPLTVGSLFSGIGGLDLGLERAGMRVVWQCESDPYARAVLRKHWPGVPCYEDVRTLRARDAVRVDLICGGFPCQDISVAGKRVGIDGERSGLWSEYARIVRELRPHYVLVENVAALLARGLERVLGDLAACGYDAEWDCLPASAFGAPHERDRFFLVAYPREQSGGEILYAGYAIPRNEQWRASEDLKSWRGWKRWLVEVDSARDEQGADPWFRGVDDGLPDELDRLRCLGNAVVPQVAEFIGRLIVAHEAAARSAP